MKYLVRSKCGSCGATYFVLCNTVLWNDSNTYKGKTTCRVCYIEKNTPVATTLLNDGFDVRKLCAFVAHLMGAR